MDFKKDKNKHELKVELCPQVICTAEKKKKKKKDWTYWNMFYLAAHQRRMPSIQQENT